MLELYLKTTEALKHLWANKDGMVSFEYIIVAACVIAVVSFVFGFNGPLVSALTGGLQAISTALLQAVPVNAP
jgi:hypothetical protein